MPNEREQFLYEVDRIAVQRHIEPAVRYALQQELSAHLEAAIQARIETDELPLIAEANAVRSLGSPRKIVDGLAEVHVPRTSSLHRPLLISMIVGLGIYSTAFMYGRGPIGQVTLYGLMAALAWFMFESWRSRRVQWLAFLVAFVPIWVGLTAGFSTQWVNIAGEEWPIQREGLAESQTVIARAIEDMKAQDAALMKGAAEYRRTGGLLTAQGFDAETGELKLRRAPNAEFARRSWEFTYASHGERLANIARENMKLASITERMTEPFYYQIPRGFISCFVYALQFTGFLFAVHAAITFLRWLIGEVARTIRNVVRSQRRIATGGAFAESPIRAFLANAKARRHEDADATSRVDTQER